MSQNAEHFTLTIFTPTYNRAHLLPRLFESIKSQVHQGDPVEWLVIDDGSTDDTVETLKEFDRERQISISYLCVENGGKHRAINLAAQRASGDWIMMLDSDDRLADGAIKYVLETINIQKGDSRVGLIRGIKIFPEQPKNRSFVVPNNPCTHGDWLFFQRPFETAEIVRRSALLVHSFPDIPGEKFMAESWLYHRLDRTHLTFFVNSPWMECFYQNSGLSANSCLVRSKSPCSAMALYEVILTSQVPLRWRVRSSVNWWRYRFHAASQKKAPNITYQPPLIFSLLGWLLYIHDQNNS